MPQAIPFNFATTGSGKNTFARPPAQWVDVRAVPAGGNVEHSIPGALLALATAPNSLIVIFSCQDDFYASTTQAPTPPSGSILDGTGPELNPTAYVVDGTQSISLSARVDTFVHMSFYVVPFFK